MYIESYKEAYDEKEWGIQRYLKKLLLHMVIIEDM